MKAARFYAPRDVRLEEDELPVARDGELVLEVLASDMCGTDLKAFVRGHPLITPPMTMGHEYSGVVSDAGIGARFRPGDRVVAANSAPCMECAYCARGAFTMCPKIAEALVGFSVPGSFAQYVRVPARIAERNTYRFDRASPEEIACAEPLAAVVHALDKVKVKKGDRVAVLGAGALGLMFLQLLKEEGAEVLMANRSPGRLQLAEDLGADQVVQVDGADMGEKVGAATGGMGADLVVEAVGKPETWEMAFAATRKGGTVLMFGGCASGTKVSFDAGKVHYGETTVVGSFHHEPSAFKRAVEFIESGKVKVAPFITHRLRLDEVARGFSLLENREAMKVALIR